jgi:hypothetical protein
MKNINNPNVKIDAAFLLRLKSFNKNIFKDKEIFLYSFITEKKINKHRIIDITLWHGNHLVYAEQAGLVLFKMKGFSTKDKSGVYFTDINEIMNSIEEKNKNSIEICNNEIVRLSNTIGDIQANFVSIKEYFKNFENEKQKLQKMFFEEKEKYYSESIKLKNEKN